MALTVHSVVTVFIVVVAFCLTFLPITWIVCIFLGLGVFPAKCPKCRHLTLRKTGGVRNEAFGLKDKVLREYKCTFCEHIEWRVRWFGKCPKCGRKGTYGKTGRTKVDGSQKYEKYQCLACKYTEWSEISEDDNGDM